MTCIMKEVNNWMHRNAREVELCLWQVLFEEGAPISVADALLAYQNDDGGFGHALEADNWNPGSTPIAACTAIKYMKMAGFYDYSHPAYQGIIRFLLYFHNPILCMSERLKKHISYSRIWIMGNYKVIWNWKV